jgi:hypothetical protein
MVRSTAMTTVATVAAVVLTSLVWLGCGGSQEKPPLQPDGPDMTAPIGDDGGAAVSPPTPATELQMSPPPGKAGGSESQTTIGH